ncbi:chorismate pyruvate-lyase family protein [Kitasatospora sp. GP82]|uniref:chorismate--pyruvate lyase family protein n=1 Tax=Kitasatospora sp. GP82 TaxID=3035089 RepID=UPI0024739610|nr:chorismate pyruvate-lyase family protein [Kitasatospora sp. GP82]MDH6124062.1 chorismate-pyruvate lyase [Kitasatospora sp. GP82]
MSPTTFLPPAVTRMLLAADGSTTLLLEALLDTELSVEVLDQETVSARRIDADLRATIRVDDDSEVLVRRSVLRTADGDRVSENYVVGAGRRTSGLQRVVTDRRAPIGRGLMALGLSQSRRILEVGQSDWEAPDGTQPCAFKAYVLVEGDDPVLYIHEKFNPSYVPPATTNSTATAADAIAAVPGSRAVPQETDSAS